MLLVILVGIIASVIVGYLFYRGSESRTVAIIAGLLLGGVLWSLFAAFIAWAIGQSMEVVWEETGTIELVSLRGGSKIEGRFFLGCGRINQEDVYYFYKKLKNGGFKQDHVIVLETTIFEEDRNDGEIIIYESRLRSPNLFVFDSPGRRYEIKIPKGSLKKSFLLE